MDTYEDSLKYTSKRYVEVRPIHNDDSQLSFQIQPEKSYLLLSDLLLYLEIKIDSKYLPDNQFVDKLFSTLEVIINNDTVTRRSMANEYFYTSFFLKKCMYDPESIRSSLRPQGWFSQNNINNDIFLSSEQNHIALAQKMISDRTMSEITTNGTRYRKYIFIAPICTPVTMQYSPLPICCPVKVNFKRANPKNALLKLTNDADITYDYNNFDLQTASSSGIYTSV